MSDVFCSEWGTDRSICKSFIILLCDLANAREVTLDNGVDGLVAVNVKVLAAAEIECLIHADVNALGAEALLARFVIGNGGPGVCHTGGRQRPGFPAL